MSRTRMSNLTPVKNGLIPADAQRMGAWLVTDGCDGWTIHIDRVEGFPTRRRLVEFLYLNLTTLLLLLKRGGRRLYN